MIHELLNYGFYEARSLTPASFNSPCLPIKVSINFYFIMFVIIVQVLLASVTYTRCSHIFLTIAYFKCINLFQSLYASRILVFPLYFIQFYLISMYGRIGQYMLSVWFYIFSVLNAFTFKCFNYSNSKKLLRFFTSVTAVMPPRVVT